MVELYCSPSPLITIIRLFSLNQTEVLIKISVLIIIVTYYLGLGLSGGTNCHSFDISLYENILIY